MSKYKVVTAHCVHAMLLQHTAFIAGVSAPAAKRFRDEFADVLKRLSENPFQIPPYEDPKWYKAVFSVSDNVVYLDAVIDCRAKSDTFWADK